MNLIDITLGLMNLPFINHSRATFLIKCLIFKNCIQNIISKNILHLDWLFLDFFFLSNSQPKNFLCSFFVEHINGCSFSYVLQGYKLFLKRVFLLLQSLKIDIEHVFSFCFQSFKRHLEFFAEVIIYYDLLWLLHLWENFKHFLMLCLLANIPSHFLINLTNFFNFQLLILRKQHLLFFIDLKFFIETFDRNANLLRVWYFTVLFLNFLSYCKKLAFKFYFFTNFPVSVCNLKFTSSFKKLFRFLQIFLVSFN